MLEFSSPWVTFSVIYVRKRPSWRLEEQKLSERGETAEKRRKSSY